MHVCVLAAILAVAAHAEPVRIMCLGNSISEGKASKNNTYRYHLWKRLVADGLASGVDFVGCNVGRGGSATDGADEGWDSEHCCFYSAKASEILNGEMPVNSYSPAGYGNIHDWAPEFLPTLAIIHLGTNDCRGGASTQAILGSLEGIITVLRNSVSDVKVIVAQLIPSRDDGVNAKEASLNAAIPDWAEGLSTPQSPIVVVDQTEGFSASTDLLDTYHPNQSGATKMCDVFYPALMDFLGAGQPSVLNSLGISPSGCPLTPGTSTQLNVTGYDQFGRTMTLESPVTWQADIEGAVSATGLLTAPQTTGTVITVSASSDGASGSEAYTVVDTNAYVLRMNMGGDAVGTWAADAHFQSGTAYTFSSDIVCDHLCAAAPVQVYESCRHNSPTYQFPASLIPDGPYLVRMHFADGAGSTGQRSMTISVESEVVLEHFDIVGEAGRSRALVQEAVVQVSGGDGMTLVLDATDGIDAFMSGLEVFATEGAVAVGTRMSRPGVPVHRTVPAAVYTPAGRLSGQGSAAGIEIAPDLKRVIVR